MLYFSQRRRLRAVVDYQLEMIILTIYESRSPTIEERKAVSRVSLMFQDFANPKYASVPDQGYLSECLAVLGESTPQAKKISEIAALLDQHPSVWFEKLLKLEEEMNRGTK